VNRAQDLPEFHHHTPAPVIHPPARHTTHAEPDCAGPGPRLTAIAKPGPRALRSYKRRKDKLAAAVSDRPEDQISGTIEIGEIPPVINTLIPPAANPPAAPPLTPAQQLAASALELVAAHGCGTVIDACWEASAKLFKPLREDRRR
jgi:hypothetical protein